MLLFEHQQQTKKLLVSQQFSWPYGITKYSSGWKDIVNQCLGFACDPEDSKPIFLYDTPAYNGASPETFRGLALKKKKKKKNEEEERKKWTAVQEIVQTEFY